jgi:hypothetical protein
LVTAELIKNFATIGFDAILLRGFGNVRLLFYRMVRLFSGAESFSDNFRLHGVTSVCRQRLDADSEQSLCDFFDWNTTSVPR